ncbi:MAG: iron ABC transporter permease [Azospirillaceae bacterium]
MTTRVATRAPAGPARPPALRVDGERVLLAVVTVYVAALCALPLLRLLSEAVAPAGGEGTAALVEEVFSSRFTRIALVNTLEASLGATVLSIVLGTGTALAVGLTDIRARTAFVFLLILPLLIPAQISALAWLELIGPSSPLWRLPLIENPARGGNPLYSREGIILLMGIEHAPMVFLAVRAGLRTLPGELVEAARASGIGPARATVGIVLPLLRPAIIAGGALAFVSAIGNFGVPALLGIPGRYTMLTTLIYQRLNGFGPSVLGEVAVLAFVLALLAAAGLALQAIAKRRGRLALDRTSRPLAPFTLGPWRPVVETALGGLLAVIAILPLLALVSTSLIQAIGVPLTPGTATLEHYRDVLFDNDATRRAFVNSFALAGAAAVATGAIAVPIAFLAVRRRSRVARLLDGVADAPFALPGIVLAIACILVYLRPLPVLDVSLYNTAWIILVAYLGRFLAVGLRPAAAGMESLDPAQEEAAQICGAGALKRLREIVLPTVAPTAAAGALLVFLLAVNELTVSALLWSTGNETLGVVVFSLYDEGNATAAAAVAVLSVAATLAVAALASLVARRLPHGVLPWQA